MYIMLIIQKKKLKISPKGYDVERAKTPNDFIIDDESRGIFPVYYLKNGFELWLRHGWWYFEEFWLPSRNST